jgi:hypothetical protein
VHKRTAGGGAGGLENIEFRGDAWSLNEHSAMAGTRAAKRCALRLGLAAVALTLAACSTPRPLSPAPPPTEAAQADPAPAEPSPVDPTSPPPQGAPPVEPASGAPPVEPPAPEQPATEEPPTENVLESTRRNVRSTTEWLVRGVDSWFGDKPFEEGGEVKDGRLSIGFFKRKDESLDTRVRFNARLRLPNVERRAYLFIGRDNEREVVADTPGAFSRQERLLTESGEDRSFFAGLGLSLLDVFDLRIGFHGIRPYAQARYRRPWSLSERDLVEFRQTFFWRVSDHFGSTTALSYEHALSSSLALRWLSATTITQVTKKFDWSSIVGAYQAFGEQRLLSLEAITSGRVASGPTVGEYGVQTKWLQPVYRDWLLGEFLVGYYWPRIELSSHRTERWGLGFAVTMRF